MTKFYVELPEGVNAFFTSRAKTEKGIIREAVKALEERYGIPYTGMVDIHDIRYRRPNLWGRGPAYIYAGDVTYLLDL